MNPIQELRGLEPGTLLRGGFTWAAVPVAIDQDERRFANQQDLLDLFRESYVALSMRGTTALQNYEQDPEIKQLLAEEARRQLARLQGETHAMDLRNRDLVLLAKPEFHADPHAFTVSTEGATQALDIYLGVPDMMGHWHEGHPVIRANINHASYDRFAQIAPDIVCDRDHKAIILRHAADGFIL